MTSIKTLTVRASYVSGLPRLLANPPETSLTTVLFHRFVFSHERLENARDRLKRQCEWLRQAYTPVTLSDTVHALPAGKFSPRSLLITIDDAAIDLLDFADIFRAFELPIIVFACAGWCAEASAPDGDTLLARAVNNLEWHNGQNKTISVDGGRLTINFNPVTKTAAIDQLLAQRQAWFPHLDSVLTQLRENPKSDRDRTCCSWDELSDLRKLGAQIEAHSVSHIRLADASPMRLAFEIVEAKRILQERFTSCEAFAYPYGMRGTYNQSTTAVLAHAGFDIAFLTIAGFAGAGTGPFHMPRIALPDRPLGLEEFRARVGGGAVVLAKAQDFFRAVARRE